MHGYTPEHDRDRTRKTHLADHVPSEHDKVRSLSNPDDRTAGAGAILHPPLIIYLYVSLFYYGDPSMARQTMRS